MALGNNKEEPETPFAERRMPLGLNVLWLGNLGMSPQYLRMGELQSLSGVRFPSGEGAAFRTRLNALQGEAFLPAGMALLAASLAMLLFPYRPKALPIIGVLLAGYLAHFAFTAFLLMGEFGYVRPAIGGWFVPMATLLGVGGVLYAIQRQRGLGLRLRDTPVLGGDARTDVSSG